jgi:hypothetical protein
MTRHRRGLVSIDLRTNGGNHAHAGSGQAVPELPASFSLETAVSGAAAVPVQK